MTETAAKNDLHDDELKVDILEVKVSHEDNRRVLKEIFNGDFVARQSLLYEVKEDSTVGGHYHTYDEIWAVLHGQINYTFINVDTQKKKTFSLHPGQAVRIPKRTYHEAKIYRGTILLGFTEQPYISDKLNNVPFKND